MYNVRVSLYLESFGLSDQATERLGIRSICSVEDPELSGHVFYVNAERVRNSRQPAAVRTMLERLMRMKG